MPARLTRLVPLALLAGLCLAPAGAAALDAASKVRFGFVPQRAFQGQPASLTVKVQPTGVRCGATIRYAGGRRQGLGTIRARGGRASWRWRVPAGAAQGRAIATVSCGSAGRNTRSFTVAGAPAAPARVVVEKSGYSQRVRFTTREVSYGIVLSNPSPDKDALDVKVLVNFVDATNRVVKTETTSVGGVRAESQYFLGGTTTIPDGTPVSSLEIVTRIGSQAVRALRSPATADIQVLASKWDPGWVGAVQGQILNDHPTMMLTNAQVSAVIFDPAGNVIGGGTGYASASLLPGVRAYFQANGGVGAIPIDRASTAGISVLGTYQPVG